MTDMETVKAHHPYALAFRWTGFWRIYSTDCIRDEYCISPPCSIEDLAWFEARAFIETELAEGSTK